MIVKIPSSSSASIDGVRYNTDKVDRGNGELMLVRDFGLLQGLMNLRPEDAKNYLKMDSVTNKAGKKPQFHAAISVEGRSYDKQQLTKIAVQWMGKTGYSDQPYLVKVNTEIGRQHIELPAPVIAASIDDEAPNRHKRKQKTASNGRKKK